MNYKHDIFLSHNSVDKPWTEKLATAIEADPSGPQLNVFFDKWDISLGSDITLELEEGLQNSKYVGLVLSPNSLNSDWVALERSTAIYKDPRARKQHLIPILRKDCDIPDMLARLNYIDFRNDYDFENHLKILINFLRGRPSERGGNFDEDKYKLREDANLVNQHRQIFERRVFRVPCIEELFLREVIDALDDTSAALNTGSLYSRRGHLLSQFENRKAYRTE